MLSKSKRVLGVTTAVATLAAGLGMLAGPASARVAEKNDKFCAVFNDAYAEDAPDIDFEGLGPAEAEFAATLNRNLAKTGVPAKLKKDLKKLAKIYDRIADGATESEIADEQDFILKALTRFSKYVTANCQPAVPSS